MKNKFTEKFLLDSFHGCINNKSEVLKYDVCGCFNCLEISKTENIVDWVTESNGGEETATCQIVLSIQYLVMNIQLKIFYF